jgi:hypothetical protein
MKKFLFTLIFSHSFALHVNPQAIKMAAYESSQSPAAGVWAGGIGVGF